MELGELPPESSDDRWGREKAYVALERSEANQDALLCVRGHPPFEALGGFWGRCLDHAANLPQLGSGFFGALLMYSVTVVGRVLVGVMGGLIPKLERFFSLIVS
jgi:hypothetical protein